MQPPSKTGHARGGIFSGEILLFLCLAASLLPLGGSIARAEPPCEPTRQDSEGPFYRPGVPERVSTGEELIVSGRLLGAPDCRPLPEGRIEWWHAAKDGSYDDAHRGSMKTNPGGTYRYTTDFPGKYPWRPLHIHMKAYAPGYRPLTTQLYIHDGEKQVTFDIVLIPLR